MKRIQRSTPGSPRRWLALGLVAVALIVTGTPAAAQRGARQARATVVAREGPSAPRVGSRTTALPRGHARITVGSKTYYYHDGVFYRPASSGFAVVSAPVGARVVSLPVGARIVRVGSIEYRYHQGVFYRWLPGIRRFEVVRAPLGAEVTYLPPGATAQQVGGVDVYVHAGVRYHPLIRDGVTFYLIIS